MARYTLGSLAIRIWTADPTDPKTSGGGAIIVNRDLTNQVLLGFGPEISVARTITQDPSGSILDPLGSITIDGSRDVWAVSAKAGTTPLVDVIANASYWAPSPAQVAAQIAAAGIFNVTNSTLVTNLAATNVGPASTFVLNSGNPFTMTQPGYEIFITSVWNTAPTAGDQVSIQLQWIDPNTGLAMINDEWFIMAGANGTAALKIHGTGPTKAAQLAVTLNNADTTGTWTASVLLLNNSRTYATDEWEWTNQSAVSFTADLPALQATTPRWSGELGRRLGTSVAASATDATIIGLWYGQIWFSFHSHGSALSIQFKQRPFGLATNTGGTSFLNQTVTDLSGTLWAPRGPLELFVNNAQTTTQTFDFVANVAGGTA